MEIEVCSDVVDESKSVEALLIYLFEEDKTDMPHFPFFYEISDYLETRIFKGSLGETSHLIFFGKNSPKVLLVGLGKPKNFGYDSLREATASAVKVLINKKIKSAALFFEDVRMINQLNPAQIAQVITEGAILGSYKFKKYKTINKEDDKKTDYLVILTIDERVEDSYRQGIRKGKILAEAVNFARELSEEPANYGTPTAIAEKAIKIAKDYSLGIEVFGHDEIVKMGMGAFAAVTQGSQEPAKLIILKYNCGQENAKTLALVGKGITFDSGGISIKTPDKLHKARDDKGGAATVLATFQAIGQLRPDNLNVIGILPCTENLPSGSAYRPGDVVVSLEGKTIEIISTDAEGRLLLADALTYARKLGADYIVDIATLTGGCRIALGHIAYAVIGNNQKMVDLVLEASRQNDEKVWQLPLFDEYREQNNSLIADLKNDGGPAASTISAAAFLDEFTGNTPWAHIDIAGTILTEGHSPFLAKAYYPSGATGVCVRPFYTLIELLSDDKNRPASA